MGKSLSSRLFRLLAACVVLGGVVALTGCGGDLPKDAVAKVGITLITQEQFDSLKAQEEAAGRAPNKDSQEAEYAQFERGVAQYLVTMEVLRQKAAASSVAVTEQDVQAEIAKVKDMFDNDDERFNEALKKMGMTIEQLTESTRDSLLMSRMKDSVTQGLKATNEEAKAYYDAHKSDYVKQEERDVRHILISPFPGGEPSDASPSQEDWDSAQAEADKVRAEIQNGADFKSEALKYSDDAATKDAGGKLGLVVRGQMVPAFDEAVFSLKKGELSDPVKTQYGYHLIEVTDIVPEEQLSYDEVSENIKSAILTQKQDDAWQAWLAEQEKALGVEYREDLKPRDSVTSTTSAAGTSSTQEQ